MNESEQYEKLTGRKPKRGDLMVWHAPQLSCGVFVHPVLTWQEGIRTLGMLGRYDLFQLKERIKPDYASASGLIEYNEKEDEWVEWENEETGEGADFYTQHWSSDYDY